MSKSDSESPEDPRPDSEPQHELKPKAPKEDLVPLDELALRDAAASLLVDRAQNGDAESLNQLFERYHGILIETARRRLGPRLRMKEDADDLAQTTFREATRDFQRYEWRGEGSLLRWLIQILQNKIRDKAEYYSAGKRDMSRERSVEDKRGGDGPSWEPEMDGLSVTRQVAREEEFSILREALEDLSEDHRKAITLVFFQGLTLRKAGEQMDGRTEDAVRMLLRRAEGRLREITKKRLARE
ncbi:MAG: RNA polymerase sigma-70 factor (subfamily 1) [Planctomycetota bacterium]